MTTVRPFEADLLHVLRAILGQTPIERAMGIILARRPWPKCLGRPALGLIRDTLARGCVRRLARQGGWIREQFLRGDRASDGRLWERTDPESLGLAFSTDSLELLSWLVAETPSPEPTPAWPRPEMTASGDLVLTFFAYEALRLIPVGEMLRSMPLFHSHGLCRLAFPADFAATAEPDPVDFTGWVQPSRSWILEAFQGTLTDAWLAADRAKREISGPSIMIAIGAEQKRISDAFLTAVDTAGRRDLARFLLRVAGELLGHRPGLETWTGSLDLKGLSLSGRSEANQAALATFASLGRLRGWERAARGVGYFDEGYAAAQLGKMDWERAGGEELWEHARSLLRATDPLAMPA